MANNSDKDKFVLTEEQLEDMAASSAWKSVGAFLKKSAQVTGSAAKYLYDTSSQNKHYVMPAIIGLLGDRMETVVGEPALRLSFRANDKDVAVTDLQLKTSLTGNGKHIVIFAHGLMVDEMIWQHQSEDFVGYGPRLAKDLGPTVLYIRYNTGLHISHNGRSLAALLEELMQGHGEDIASISLIGHSMGGLVIRSAGHYGQTLGHKWIAKLSNVYLIGTPTSGAMLEKVAHLTAAILKTIPNIPTRIISKIIDERSDGIKDLRLGLMVDEDWQHARSDSVLFNLRTRLEPLPKTRYHVILGTLANDISSPLAIYFGDGMVSKSSATGSTLFSARDPLAEVGTYKVFAKTHHLGLLFSDEVYQYLKETLPCPL